MSLFARRDLENGLIGREFSESLHQAMFYMPDLEKYIDNSSYFELIMKRVRITKNIPVAQTQATGFFWYARRDSNPRPFGS